LATSRFSEDNRRNFGEDLAPLPHTVRMLETHFTKQQTARTDKPRSHGPSIHVVASGCIWLLLVSYVGCRCACPLPKGVMSAGLLLGPSGWIVAAEWDD
jgi:hypothetical protein